MVSTTLTAGVSSALLRTSGLTLSEPFSTIEAKVAYTNFGQCSKSHPQQGPSLQCRTQQLSVVHLAYRIVHEGQHERRLLGEPPPCKGMSLTRYPYNSKLTDFMQTLRYCLISPSAAEGGNRSSRKGYAALHKIEHVTLASIAYAATLVRQGFLSTLLC